MSSVITHPNYSIGSQLNDIALVKLESALSFTSSIGYINLPNLNDKVSTMSTGYATGWGGKGETQNQLQTVDLKKVPICGYSDQYFCAWCIMPKKGVCVVSSCFYIIFWYFPFVMDLVLQCIYIRILYLL